MASAATAAEQRHKAVQDELAAVLQQLTRSGEQMTELQAQLQQLGSAHEVLKASSSAYQQELEGREPCMQLMVFYL